MPQQRPPHKWHQGRRSLREWPAELRRLLEQLVKRQEDETTTEEGPPNQSARAAVVDALLRPVGGRIAAYVAALVEAHETEKQYLGKFGRPMQTSLDGGGGAEPDARCPECDAPARIAAGGEWRWRVGTLTDVLADTHAGLDSRREAMQASVWLLKAEGKRLLDQRRALQKATESARAELDATTIGDQVGSREARTRVSSLDKGVDKLA